MKVLALLMLSVMFASCASHQGREIASEETQKMEKVERFGLLRNGSGYQF
jgi:hypothetical protein